MGGAQHYLMAHEVTGTLDHIGRMDIVHILEEAGSELVLRQKGQSDDPESGF
jgi:hypothetical protein